MTIPAFRTLSPHLRLESPETLRSIAEIVRQTVQGKMNVVATLTLTDLVATTVFQDPRIGVHSFIGWQPLTATAATELATLYTTSQTSQMVTFNHAVSAATDRIFRLVILA